MCNNFSNRTHCVLLCIILFLFSSQALAKPCSVVATLVTASGKVEYQPSTSDKWYKLSSKISLCTNSKIRVGKNSRVSIRLSNNTIIRLKENSLLKFSPTEKNKFVNLLKGVGHFISRIKDSFEVKTPLINAFIEGTEFVVAITPQQGQVSVLEGRVRTYNKHGTVTLSAGQISVAKVGQAPVLRLDMRAQDEINWAIDYPVSLFSSKSPKINRAINLLKSGKSSQAKNLLNQPNIKQKPDSVALLALILLSENQRQKALSLINSSTINNENTILVKSYIYQALHDLDKASSTLKTTNAGSTANLRQAELALLEGNADKARKFLSKVKPGTTNKTIYSALSFMLDGHPKQAQKLLKKNQKTNKDNPQFWLILGLSTIQQGDATDGIKHLEQAVGLSPNNSLYRNYLGRAYLAQQNFIRADAQFALAENMDANNPSIYLHQAISAISQNELSDALTHLGKANKNIDKRAVYRKSGMRAADQANLLAKQGALYKALGNNNMAQHSADKATELAPNNPAVHQLQSDLFIGKQRLQEARANERYRSLLYSPLHRTPLLPSLADQNLILLNDTALFTPGLHEYDELFSRKGLHGNLNLYGAGQNTKSAELGLNLVGNNTVLGIGYLDYETDGFFDNDFREYKIKNLFLQHKFNQQLSVQFEHFEKEQDIGDIIPNFFINPDEFYTENEELDYNRLGLGLKLNDRWSLYTSFGKYNKTNSDSRQLSTLITINSKSQLKSRAASIQLTKTGAGSDVFGLDYAKENISGNIELLIAGTSIPIPQPDYGTKKYTSLYWYRNFNLNSKVNLNAGLEYTSFKNPVKDSKRFYPKFAINLKTNSGWLHTLSYLESIQLPPYIHRPAPFTFAGQIHDLDNTVAYQNKTLGITSLLNKNSYSLYSKFQYSKGKEFIENTTGSTLTDKYRDYAIKLAAFKKLSKKTSAKIEFNYAKAQTDFNRNNFLDSTIPENLETYTFGLTFDFKLSKSAAFNLTGTYVKQEVNFVDVDMHDIRAGTVTGKDNFFILDLETKIKLPAKGNNHLFLGIKNMTNIKFKYQDNNYRSFLTSPFPYARERLFYVKLQHSF